MRIDSLQSLFQNLRVAATEPVPDPLAVDEGPSSGDRADLLRARTRLLDLFRGLRELEALTLGTSRLALDLPDARSNPALSLDLSATPARLASAEEINTVPTSFTPFGPDWGGSSSALLTVGGVYDGSLGAGTLTFESRSTGIVGVNRLRIRILDPGGSVYGNIQVRENDPPGQRYDIGAGLSFTIGSGFLAAGDTATFDVSDTVGSAVDPMLPLGGVRNDNPNFEPTAPAVQDGGFRLNGQLIGVSTTDSIDDVIARINASGAGVGATFDAAAERIRLEQETPGSAATIRLADDTSNFLAATKLVGATLVPGTDPETERPLAEVAQFGTVQGGSLQINGQAVAIDPAADSLDDVIARINDSGTGAVARFDSDSRQVVIEAASGNDILELDSNGTGFFGAANLPEGRVDTEIAAGGISRRRSYELADALEAVFADLNALFRDQTFAGGIDNASLFRGPLAGTIQRYFSGERAGLTDAFGLAFSGLARARTNGTYASLDRAVFTRGVQRRGDDIRALLFGSREQSGLVGELAGAVQRSIGSINQILGVNADALIDEFV